MISNLNMAEFLCTACSRFANDFGKVGQEGWSPILNVAPDFHSLAKLARGGCSLCQIVYQSCCYAETVSYERDTLPIRVRAWMEPDSYSEFADEEDDGLPFRDEYPRRLFLIVTIGEEGQSRSHFLPLVMDKGAEKATTLSESHTDEPIINLCSSGGVDDAVALAKHWILECDNSHTACNDHPRTKQQPKVVPTRLIDVGSTHGGRPPRVYIQNFLDHEDVVADVEYAALSYAWGSDPTFATTTASNVGEMTECLPWDKLAKTIQEAIIFTRKLGIKYLWVDALCILQNEGPDDSFHKADWSYEAGRFGQYYENAKLTIAATGAISSDKGLFLPRPALQVNPKPVTFPQETFWGGIRETTAQPISPAWEYEIDNSPLLSRGWAFQERVLSKRVLHFGMNCILWECHEGRAIETAPHRLGPVTSEEIGYDFVHTFKHMQDLKWEDFVKSWYRFASRSSMDKFTFASDRLPALSGIAARIQHRFPQKYIAGLWEFNITQGLAWGVHESPDHKSPSLADLSMGIEGEAIPSELNMPSWSWASSDKPIHFFFWFDEWTSMITIKSWAVETKGAETSGQVLHGTLRLKGLFQVMKLVDLTPPFSRVQFDRYGFAYEEDLAKHLSDRLYPCILLGTESRFFRSHRAVSLLAGALILQPTGRSVDSVEEYRRIGFFRAPYEEHWSEVTETRTIDLV